MNDEAKTEGPDPRSGYAKLLRLAEQFREKADDQKIQIAMVTLIDEEGVPGLLVAVDPDVDAKPTTLMRVQAAGLNCLASQMDMAAARGQAMKEAAKAAEDRNTGRPNLILPAHMQAARDRGGS